MTPEMFENMPPKEQINLIDLRAKEADKLWSEQFWREFWESVYQTGEQK